MSVDNAELQYINDHAGTHTTKLNAIHVIFFANCHRIKTAEVRLLCHVANRTFCSEVRAHYLHESYTIKSTYNRKEIQPFDSSEEL